MREFLWSNVMKNQKSTANKDLSPEDRYDQDPQFKALVDILGALIRQARFTPTELREAVKVAKKSRQARVCENAQANKARDVFRGWQVHHHF